MTHKEYYETIANRRNIWTVEPTSDLYYQERLRYDAILDLIPSTVKNVLDLGCGDGYLSALIAQKGFRVIGFDLSANRLRKFDEIAKKHGIRQVIGNVTSPGLSDQSFDQVVCSEVIEHIENFRDVLHETFRLLKPGGRLIVTVPHKEKLKTILCPHCNTPFHENGHLHRFDRDKLSEALTEVGFTILKTQTMRHRLLVQIQYHLKLKYGFFLRNLDRLLSWLTPDLTVYLLVMARK